MADINIETTKESQTTKIIPAHNVYPDVRLTVDSGVVVAAGDRVKITMSVVDKDGVNRIPDQKVIYKFKDLPDNSLNEILGAVNISFVESPKPIVTP